MITVAGVSTGITKSSSNLGGVVAATTVTVTTSENSTLTDSGNAAGSEIHTDSQFARGRSAARLRRDLPRALRVATTDSHSLYEVDGLTVNESDTITSTAGGVNTSETIQSASTDTPTSTLSGNSTETQTTTDTVAFGTDGVVTSGGDTLWDTVTDSRQPDALLDWKQPCLGHHHRHLRLGGVTVNVANSRTPASPTSTETQTATTTLGGGDLVSGGNSFDSLYETGADSSSGTETDIGTTTESGNTTFSDSVETASSGFSANISAHQTLTSAAGLRKLDRDRDGRCDYRVRALRPWPATPATPFTRPDGTPAR